MHAFYFLALQLRDFYQFLYIDVYKSFNGYVGQCQTIHGKGNLAETFSRLALMTFSADGKSRNLSHYIRRFEVFFA